MENHAILKIIQNLFIKLRPLKNVQFWPSTRKAIILTTGILLVFRGLKFEPDAAIGQKGVLCKGLKLSVAFILISVSGIAAICFYPLPASSQEMPLSVPAAGPSPSAASDQLPVKNGVFPGMMPQPDQKLPGLPAPAPQTGPPLPSLKEQPGEALNAAAQRRTGQVTFNFDDADVYEVIQTIFGQVLKVNYIVDPGVKGRVTFRSSAPVPQQNVLPLMEVILRLNGIAVVEEAGLYRVVPISAISKEPAAVQLGRDSKGIILAGKALLQVVPIRYMQSSDVLKLLTPFVSANAVMVDVPMSNQIVIVDTDANVKRLLELVEIFDNEQQKKKGPQVFVYAVQNGKAKEIATQLQQIFLGGKAAAEKTAAVTAPQSQMVSAQTQQVTKPSQGGETLVSGITRIFSDEVLNVVIVLATPEDYEIIKDAIAKIDIVPRQVMIEGMIAQIGLTDNLSLGLAWSINAGKLGKIFGTNEFGVDTAISLNPASLPPAGISSSGLNLIGTDAGNSVRAIISALASQSKAKLLAAPHILVSDNREASIQVGQQVPIATSETFGTPGVAPQRTIQYKDIGIILKVKPRVNESGLVSLELRQEVSTFSLIELSVDQKDIILNKTETSTSLVVQDGHTIIIGGLIREDTTKTRSGIPWLTKIPVLGYLFGNTDDNESRTEIIILLTPHVLKNQADAKDLTVDIVDKFTGTGKGGIDKKDLFKNGDNLIRNRDIKPAE
jgi:general secretion pathway protein D